MTSVVIYLVYEGKEEAVEFYTNDTPEDVKNLLQTAAGAEPEDDLKLYNEKGNLIFIHAKMKPNDPATRYVLKVIPRKINSQRLLSLVPTAEADLDRIVQRLSQFEKTITECEMPESLINLQQKYNRVLVAVNGLKYLTFLRIKDEEIPYGRQRVMVPPFWWQPSPEKIELHRKLITQIFYALLATDLSPEVKQDLKQSNFDNWQCSDAHMIVYIRQMFMDLGLVEHFNMDDGILKNFLLKVYHNYNFVPFHNFRHCFSVTQMMYSLICSLDLKSQLDHLDIFTLMTTAMCHDLDHSGYNNLFQQNSNSELYVRYRESPLEHHHVAIALKILNDETCNIDRFLPQDRILPFRDLMKRIILATDLARSGETVNALNAITELDLTKLEHKHLILTALIKVSDISNEARKIHISGRWLDCLLQEFFTQHEVEIMDGLPTADFMNKDKVTKPSAQIGFIENVLLPLLKAVRKFFPKIQELIDTAQENLIFYKEMQIQFTPEDVKVKTVPISMELNSARKDNSAESASKELVDSAGTNVSAQETNLESASKGPDVNDAGRGDSTQEPNPAEPAQEDSTQEPNLAEPAQDLAKAKPQE